MQSGIRSRVASNFFLDGAKIIFGSLVIGVFVPSVSTHEFPWAIFLAGAIATTFFLLLAHATAENYTTNTSRQHV